MRQRGRQLDEAGLLIDRGGLDGRDLMLARGILRTMSSPLDKRGIAEGPVGLARERRPGWSRSATSPDWSARPAPWPSAAAIAPIVSLDRVHGGLHRQDDRS